MIIEAEPKDAKELTDLALVSKKHWGYSNALIQLWEDDLRVTSEMIHKFTVFNFLIDEEIAGFYILNTPADKVIELEFLFVNPKYIGKGVGKSLLKHACKNALAMKCFFMKVLSDPNATRFYEKHNFIIIDEQESKIPNRSLPILQKDLRIL